MFAHSCVAFHRSLESERLNDNPESSQSQVLLELKSSASSTLGSEDSLDKSDLEESATIPDSLANAQRPKPYQRSPSRTPQTVLELGGKCSAFTPTNKCTPSRDGPSSTFIKASLQQQQRQTQHRPQTQQQQQQHQQQQQQAKKRNPYSIEELLKKDDACPKKRPRLSVAGVVQPCGIVVVGKAEL
ncbi:unnamed protein product [Trichogramma brassicae]|uniref:Uncharacterized protein n=1 Tax=Trichogramma brassicae TaxID=86971 RepID=A0A6H5I2A6_9HYME|nr:unnamed protein product [Trichogramma brassicae]